MKIKTLIRSHSGSSLVEFAFLMAFLLPPLLVGVIEIGRYANLSILVGNAARTGAAYGAQTTITAADMAGITNAATKDFSFDKATLGVSTKYSCACDNGGAVGQPTYYDGVATKACPLTCPAAQNTVVSVQVTACTSTLKGADGTASPPSGCGSFSPLFRNGWWPNMTISKTAEMRIGECPTCPQ
jgi:Flp pilus assembly protein TadG